MSPPDQTPEKRRNTRLTSPKVVVRIPSVDRFRTHYLKDISEGGLFVKAETVLAAGALLSLEVWPPGWDHPVEVSAKVTRSTDPKTAAAEGRPCGMAVQFVSVPAEVARQLEKLVNEHRDAAAAADPVGAQIEALVQELSTSRERFGKIEAELLDVRGQNEALTEQVEALQREEADARAAAAKLGEERTDLEQRQREASVAQAKLVEELAVVRGEAEGVERELEAEREESMRQRQRADDLEKQLDEERQRARARDARERGLRKLLDRVSAPSPLASIVEEEEEVVVVAGSEPLDAAPSARTPSRPPPPPPPTPLPRPPSNPPARPATIPPDSRASSGLPEIDLDVDDLNLGEPGANGGEEEAAALFEDEPLGGPGNTSPASPEADEDPPGFSTFVADLKPRTRVMGTEQLSGFEPGTEEEKLVVELVGASPTFSTLSTQVEGKIDEARLRRVLFDLDRRKLVELRN